MELTVSRVNEQVRTQVDGDLTLTWLDPYDLDERTALVALSLLEAARQVDRPDGPPPSPTHFLAVVRHGWDGDPMHLALATDGTGRPVGVVQLRVSQRDNPHLADLSVTVDPVLRRRGIGRRLFELGLDRVRAMGRTVLLASANETSPGARFLTGMGLEPVYHEVARRLDVLDVDWERLERMAADAAAHARDYELVRLPFPVPDDLVDEVGRMANAINDAPTGGLDWNPPTLDGTRIRRNEQFMRMAGRRLYRVVARRRDTGELAGQTVAVARPEAPWWVDQEDTSVVRAHRGHRLGLLLKIEMLRWLREAEPQARWMDTWNAADNSYMIAVNEKLGYRVVARINQYQRRL